jgi:hypothetical protein
VVTTQPEDGSRRACSRSGGPGHGKTRYAVSADGAPCKGGWKNWRPGATQGAPRTSRQSSVVAVLTIGTRYAAETAHRVLPCPSIRRHGCDHPQPHSEDVYVRFRESPWMDPYGGCSPNPRIYAGVCRGAGERDARIWRRRKCQTAGQQPPQFGARAEARLAWSKLPSASDHFCKPSRSSYPRVVFPRAPALAAPDPYFTISKCRRPSRTPRAYECSAK